MKVVITDYEYQSIDTERAILEEAGYELKACHLKTSEEIIEEVKDAEAIIVQYAEITREIIQHMERAKLIVRYGIGVNNIDERAAAEKGIYVCNVPDYGVEEVANHAVMLILALAKKVIPLDKSIKEGKWDYNLAVPEYRISECKLGLIGFGRIPQAVAKRLGAFGMGLMTYDPYLDSKKAEVLGVKMVDYSELLEKSDFISVHCPLTEDTYHMIGMQELKAMKKSAFLVNTARGGIIDEKALVFALKKGIIAGAGLDVFEKEPIDFSNELLNLPNCITTPHCAWYSETAISNLKRMVAEEVVNVLGGNKPFHCVNKSLIW